MDVGSVLLQVRSTSLCLSFVLIVTWSNGNPNPYYFSITGYINRLRGYHADDHETPGFQDGIIPSYYYALKDRFLHMQEFYPVKKSFYAREFPTSWRLIDTGLNE